MCSIAGKGAFVATNLALDDELIRQAVKLGKHKTKKEAVTAALEHYIKLRKRAGVHELIGTIDFHDDFLRKTSRRRRSA
jgi:Arc/MetJ family transcription regulator